MVTKTRHLSIALSITTYCILATLLITTCFLSSCKKEYDDIDVADTKTIQTYMQQKNLDMQQYGATGIYYKILNTGNLSAPVISYADKIPLVYTVRSLDGAYSSLDTFNVQNRYSGYLGYFIPNHKGANLNNLHSVIKEKLQRRNASIRIIIPSRFAYGKEGVNGIPANASLDYTISTHDENQQAAYDEASITKYRTANALTDFIKTTSGIHYKIDETGSSELITPNSTVTLKYTIKTLNGSIISESSQGVSFKLNTTILGWQEILPSLHNGGRVRIILPSALAYGFPDPDKPNLFAPLIAAPPFSCLDFTIQVVGIAN